LITYKNRIGFGWIGGHMLSPRAHAPVIFPSDFLPARKFARRALTDKLIFGTSVAFAAISSVLGIAAGSLVVYGLLIRAHPDSEEAGNKVQAATTPAPASPKVSKKLLVMRASAK
jgi:hypothetical protein